MRRSQQARETSYTEKMELGEMGVVNSRQRDHTDSRVDQSGKPLSVGQNPQIKFY